MTRPAIADLVFAAAAPPPPRRHQALVVTALVHLGIAAAILGAQPTLETWSAEMAARVHDELTRIQLAEVEALPPSPPPEPPPAEPAPAEPPPAAIPVPSAAIPRPGPPPRPAPARAARVVASPPGALDLTGDVVVTGHASAYAGGVTTPTGTGDRPASQASRDPTPPSPPAAQPGVQKNPAQRDRSRPVSLAGDEWNCPWPDAAEGLALDEQVAVIRVVVAADGAVESAELVADPGNGFGPAALSCARRTRFTPALDASGRPTAARSPPIRVHFFRDR